MPHRLTSYGALLLTFALLLLAILSVSCSVAGPSAQENLTQTAAADAQSSLVALNEQHTATVIAANDHATSTQSALDQLATQAAQNDQATSTSEAQASTTAIAAMTATVDNALMEANLTQDWNLALYDAFEDNNAGWPVGLDNSNDVAQIQREIADGVYQWDATGRLDFYAHAFPTGISHSNDFSVSVDIKIVSGDPSTSYYGLIFRWGGSYGYALVIDANGNWRAMFLNGKLRNQMLSGKVASATSYHLAVKGLGQDYYYYVNGEQVVDVDRDERLDPLGSVGIIVIQDAGGVSSVVEFDNFTFLTH